MELNLQILHPPPRRRNYVPPPSSPCIFLKIWSPTHSLYPLQNSVVTRFSSLRQVQANNRRWDSNAENFRAQNFNFNSQPNNDDDDDDNGNDTDEWFEVLEEFIDGAWIFPVFRSFGWILPAIISSLLITSGPKAFLMALVVPLGQSAFSLAFQKMVGRKSRKPKRKAKARTKPRARSRSARNVKLEEEEEAERESTIKDTTGYQTWVGGNDSRVDKDSHSSASFGGWDELDRRTNSSNETRKRPAQNADRPQRSKLSRKQGKGETPLLLRLLIAVFPFLGSWTKML